MRLGAFVAASLVLLAAGSGRAPGGEPDAAGPNNYALLVGCTEYPNLDRAKGLLGPANDVALLKRVLTEFYGFKDGDVVTLTEGGGAGILPTLANIRAGFDGLARKAAAGDQVVILLAGHGSQQPDADVPPDEDDGWDEIFLPRDVGKWDGPRKTVAGALVDDEVGKRLAAISSKGASVWLIVDACCSGTMYRGNGTERYRRVSPADLGVPAPGAGRARGVAPEPAAFELTGAGAGVVAVYAARPDETTPERPFPEGSADATDFGLFTYTLCEALSPPRVATRLRTAPTALTYRQLLRRVRTRYTGLSLATPTPMIEGAAGDRPVLGVGAPGGPGLVLSRAREGAGGWSVNAGQIQGLEAGSILSVHPAADSARAVGHIKVVGEGLRPLDARVTPCDPDGAPAVADLPDGAVCRPTYLHYGDKPLRVAVDPRDEDGNPVAAPERSRLADALRGAARALSGRGQHVVEVADDPARAEWLLRVEPAHGNRTYLLPGEGWPKEDPNGGRPPLYGPVPPGGEATPWLEDHLMRVFVARRLKRVASDEERRSGLRPPAPDSPRVKVELRRFASRDDHEGRALDDHAGGIELAPGNLVGFRLTNTGRTDVDVTLLFVDSGFGVTAFFPFRESSNRIPASETRSTETLVVNEKTVGLESAVVIAIAAAPGQPEADFSFLEQKTLQRARDAQRTRGMGGFERGFGSPLGRLLENCCFGHGTRGGAPPGELDDYEIQTLSCRTAAPAAHPK